MKITRAFVSLLIAISGVSAWGGSVETRFTEEEERVPVNLFSIDTGYVFESELSFDDDDDDNLGDQDAFNLSFEYAHRFHLTGPWHLRAGIAYQRFEFGETSAPVPDQLHSLAAVISLDYMVGKDVGLFLQIRPGFYAEDDFHGDSFDIPITLARAWVLRPQKLFVITGVTAAFLRGELPVLPVLGVIWHFDPRWTLHAVVPEPRIIFRASRNVQFWGGAQLTGGSFRTNADDDIVPQKLSNAVVDYTDIRLGGGVSFRLLDAVALDLGGGYSIQRRFNFARADDDFDADGAPYLRAGLKAEF